MRGKGCPKEKGTKAKVQRRVTPHRSGAPSTTTQKKVQSRTNETENRAKKSRKPTKPKVVSLRRSMKVTKLYSLVGKTEKRHRSPGTAGMREITLRGSTDVNGSENFINHFLGSLGGSFS